MSGKATKPSNDDIDAYHKWIEHADKGSGEIYLAIEDNQKHHLSGVLDNSQKMWELLERGNQSKKPGTCFNTYNDLFSVCKQENETLKDLIA